MAASAAKAMRDDEGDRLAKASELELALQGVAVPAPAGQPLQSFLDLIVGERSCHGAGTYPAGPHLSNGGSGSVRILSPRPDPRSGGLPPKIEDIVTMLDAEYEATRPKTRGPYKKRTA